MTVITANAAVENLTAKEQADADQIDKQAAEASIKHKTTGEVGGLYRQDYLPQFAAVFAPLRSLPFSRYGVALADNYAHDRLVGSLLFIGMSSLLEPLQKGWAVRDRKDEQRREENAGIVAFALALTPAAQRKTRFNEQFDKLIETDPRMRQRKGDSTPEAATVLVAATGASSLFDEKQWSSMIDKAAKRNEDRAKTRRSEYDALKAEAATAWRDTLTGEVMSAMQTLNHTGLCLSPSRALSMLGILESQLEGDNGLLVGTLANLQQSRNAEAQANMALQLRAVTQAIELLRPLGATLVRDVEQDRGRSDADLRDNGADDFATAVNDEQFMETHALNGAAWAKNYVTGRPTVQ